MVVLRLCVVGLNFSKTRFYRLLLMNGINWTLILITVSFMQFSTKRPARNTMYGIYDPFGDRLINRLRLSFNHLRGYKHRHNFADTVNL